MMFNMAGVDIDRECWTGWGNWSNPRTFVGEAVARGDLTFEPGHGDGEGHARVRAECLLHRAEINDLVGQSARDGCLRPEATDRGGGPDCPGSCRAACSPTCESTCRVLRNLRIELTSPILGVRSPRARSSAGISPNMQEVRNTKFADTVVKPYAEDTIRLPYGTPLPQGVGSLFLRQRGAAFRRKKRPWGGSASFRSARRPVSAAGRRRHSRLGTKATPATLEIGELQRHNWRSRGWTWDCGGAMVANFLA
ncbi:MAG: hypothetical protein MZV63_33925 [Marinilabiliales bacterium]|nr:hypothetical protein [Marinilabiliales bacterium]